MENNMPFTRETPDPFGRLQPNDGSQDRYKGISDIFEISTPVGPSDTNDADDVARVEIMMDHLGELDLSQTDGPTGYYGERLKQAISAYQKKMGLPETGRIAPADLTMSAVRKSINVEITDQRQSVSGLSHEATRGSLLNPSLPSD